MDTALLLRKSRFLKEIQLTIHDFYEYNIIHITTIQTNKQYETRKGLAERQIKKRLEKQGYDVWRGGMIHITRRQSVYPQIRRRYVKLICLLKIYHPDKVELLQYLCHIHHGMPDFICYRNKAFLFVECKLEHEQLSKRQKLCIRRLQKEGFSVDVIKLVTASVRTLEANVHYKLGIKSVKKKQKSLRQF